MALEHVSIDQALDVWTQLVEAYHGQNGYGGNVAEIYVYTLCRNLPAEAAGLQDDPGRDVYGVIKAYRAANLALVALCNRLETYYDDAIVEVEFNEKWRASTIVSDYPNNRHRWHVRVTRRA